MSSVGLAPPELGGPLAGLSGRHLLAMEDLSRAETMALVDYADELKARRDEPAQRSILQGRTLGLLFMKKSTRTRVSFEAGIYELGGLGLFLSADDLQLGHGETIRDTAETLSRYLDGVMIRSPRHADVVEYARHSAVPVINGMTDQAHPCQTLADLMTIREKKGSLSHVTVAFLGAALNVGRSLMIGCATVGCQARLSCPGGFGPDADALEIAGSRADQAGGSVAEIEDPAAAVRGADFVYTDGWTPPESEAEHVERSRVLARYQVNEDLIHVAGPDARVMHCLPAHYREEITEAVAYSAASVIFDQAENRLHAQKAVLAALLSR